MLKILRDGTTTIVVTLKEKTTITSVEYLWEFEEEQTGDSYYCILTDSSSYKDRYNEFSITDPTDINFPIDNYYTYTVYEQASGSGNLDPDGLAVVEKGRAYVYEVDAADNEYTNTETSSIYEPE